jgi:arylsulfatase A-like enzyme
MTYLKTIASKSIPISLILGASSSIIAAEKTQIPIKDKPNILIIMTDDQGYGQSGLTGDAFNTETLGRKFTTERYACNPGKAAQAAKEAMPVVSSLMMNGICFSEAFVASPVCGPSRAAFFTSRYPARYGVYKNNDVHNGVSSKELFLAKKFQKSGYCTAMIGKWHLGENRTVKQPNKTRDYHMGRRNYCLKKHHPLTRGFDFFYGFNASGAAYYNSPDIFRNFQNVKTKGYLTDEFTGEMLNFIRKSQHKPFFAVLAYNAPHIPLEQSVPKQYQRFNTGNSEVDNYYAALAAVDAGIGKIIAELKKQKKFKNTLIFYFSDNGAVIDSPEPANGYFKGFKGLTFQGGVHIPMVACWPNKLPAGVTYTKNVSSMDILPTCLAAAGEEVPDNLDGKNLLPYLSNKITGEPHEYLFWAGPNSYHWSEKNTVFWTQYFKWITFKSNKKVDFKRGKSIPSGTVLSGPWLLHIEAKQGKYELFNIQTDVSEAKDVSASNLKIVKRLSTVFTDWIKDKIPPNRWEKKEWEKLKMVQFN